MDAGSKAEDEEVLARVERCQTNFRIINFQLSRYCDPSPQL
jgi:hypothetical protein